MEKSFSLLTSVVIPLACGLAGGALGATWAAPAPPPVTAPAPSADCGLILQKLDALQQSLADAQRAAPVAEAWRPLVSADGGMGAGVKAVQAMVEQSQARHAEFEARMEERKAQGIERKRERAAADLLELRATQNSTPEETTRKNVQKWISTLGFSDEEQVKIAEAGASYVRQRTDALIQMLEQTTAGRPPEVAEIRRNLKALETGVNHALPSSLNEEARAGVIGRINAKVRVPVYLEF